MDSARHEGVGDCGKTCGEGGEGQLGMDVGGGFAAGGDRADDGCVRKRAAMIAEDSAAEDSSDDHGDEHG